MSRRPATKTIHYVRAVYNQGMAPQKTLEELVRSAMNKLGSMAQTDISMASLGVASVRHRDQAKGQPLRLSIGAGVSGEQMTTIGIKVSAPHDDDHATQAPANRAFKHSEFFVLLDQNDLLVITEGSFRVSTVAAYLRELISKAAMKNGDVAFELSKVTSQDRKAILEKEGIKELQLNTTMFRATQELEDGANQGVTSTLKGFVELLKTLFAEELDENKRLQLAKHWGELQVSTVIKADGGSRAEEIVLDVMRSVGEDVLDEGDDSIDVTILTKRNTPIRLGEVTPTKKVSLLRREGANDLINTEVYDVLSEYREELIGQGLWKK